MGNIIYLSQPVAATMTNSKELIKLYKSKKNSKFDKAIERNSAIYKALMNEILGRNEEASEEAIAA